MEGLLRDAPRPGRHKQIRQATLAKILRMSSEERPREATHGSTRTLAERCGVSHRTVHCVGKAYGWQPHRGKRFPLPTDPEFVARVRDIVGLVGEPAGSGLGGGGGRNEPDPGPGAHRAHPALAARHPRAADPRFPAPRRHHAVCGAPWADGEGDCHRPAPTPPRRVAGLPGEDRTADSRGVGWASDLGHAGRPHPAPKSSRGWKPIPAISSPSRPKAPAGSTRRSASWPSGRASASGGAAFAACASGNGPSASIGPGTTGTPVLLSGPPRLPGSSATSGIVNKRCLRDIGSRRIWRRPPA